MVSATPEVEFETVTARVRRGAAEELRRRTGGDAGAASRLAGELIAACLAPAEAEVGDDEVDFVLGQIDAARAARRSRDGGTNGRP